MQEIIILVGLPGSGKSHLGKQLDGTFFDDIKDLEELKKIKGKIIIADVFLCREHDREIAAEWLTKNFFDCRLEWIFFENAPEKCLKNVIYRNDGRKVENLIKELSKIYNPINGRKIWQFS